MDELEIAGQRYLSTRRAGREHKYHSDYIGQLIRGGKVVGKKVGRSWYVQESSLNAYLSGESEAPRVTPKVEPVAEKEEVKEVAVAPVAVATRVVEEVEVKTKEENNNDAPAPVHIKVAPVVPINPAPVRRVPVDETHKIQINTQKFPVKSASLRYIADDAPVLPTAPVKKIAVTVSEEVPTYESSYLPTVEEVQSSTRVGALSLAALAIAGIITFSVTAGASVAISSQTIVEEGQVAGAGFTLK
jgi:hypothetical protein